jgi:hypothetical protein
MAQVLDVAGAVRARLAPLAPARLRQVGGAADFTHAEGALTGVPAVFVVPLAETPSSPPLAAEFVQRKQIVVAVVIAVSSARDARGEAARDALTEVRGAVEDALLGWVPEGCAEALAWAGSQLHRLAPNHVLWWRDDFVTTQMVRLP